MIQSTVSAGRTTREATFRLSQNKEMVKPEPVPVDHIRDHEMNQNQEESFGFATRLLDGFKQFSKMTVDMDDQPVQVTRTEEGWFGSHTVERDYSRDAASGKGIVVVEDMTKVVIDGQIWNMPGQELSIPGELVHGTPFAAQFKYEPDNLDLHEGSLRFPEGITNLEGGGQRYLYLDRPGTYNYSKSAERDVLSFSTPIETGQLTFDYLQNTAHLKVTELEPSEKL